MATDLLSFLDAQDQDPLSFLDQNTDPLSFLDQEVSTTVPTQQSEDVVAQEIPWALRSTDPNHPFKRALREYPGRFAGALASGALSGIESFVRGGRQPGEYEGVSTMGMPNGIPSSAGMEATDALREKVYEGVDDEEVKDVLEKAEILGGFLPAERAIFGAVAGIKKIGEFSKNIKKIGSSRYAKISDKIAKIDKFIASALNPGEIQAAQLAKKRLEESVRFKAFDVLGEIWTRAKEKLIEKFKWTKEKTNAFEQGKIEFLKPEEAQELINEATKIAKEVEIPIEPVKETKKAVENAPIKELAKPTPPQVQLVKVQTIQKPEAKPPETKIAKEEPKTVETKPSSGYVRKEEPKTVPEKIAHLTQKIKESDDHASAMRIAIEEQKDLIDKLPPKGKGTQTAKQNLDEKRAGLKSEVEYGKKLRKDLKDLKAHKEKSNVQVPLGRELPRKGQQSSPAATRPLSPVVGKEQAQKRSDIVKLFKKAFTDPIRMGKFKQRALGIHKMWPKVTRLLQANDIETVAHEIGHNLHTTLYGGDAKTPLEQRNNVINALKPYLNELKPLAHYEPYSLEGFAEFVRMYVTNPKVAENLAPKFYKQFEDELAVQYPEMKDALLKARSYYNSYLQGTPASRIDSMTDYEGKKPLIERTVDWLKKYGTRSFLHTRFLDEFYPIKKVVAEAFGISPTEVEKLKNLSNVYQSLRLLKGAIGKADSFLMSDTFDPRTLLPNGKGLAEIFQPIKTTTEYIAFDRYLKARRTLEKLPQKIETGISYQDALAIVKEFSKKYGKLAQELTAYGDRLLEYAQHAAIPGEEGLLSADQVKKIRAKNVMYAPFQRVMDKDPGKRVMGGGSAQASQPIKRMKGSSRNLIPSLEGYIKNTYAIIINAEKNLTGQRFAQLAEMKDMGQYIERVPAPITLKAKISNEEMTKATIKHLLETGQDEFLEMDQDGKWVLRSDIEDLLPDLLMKFGPTTYPKDQNIITVWYGGKPRYYELSDELYQMWTNGTEPYVANILTKILSKFTGALRYGAIMNPRFIQKNFFEDMWGAAVYSKYGEGLKGVMENVYQPFLMIAKAIKKEEIFWDWMRAGGGMSTSVSFYRDNLHKMAKQVLKGDNWLDPRHILSETAHVSEVANRLVEYSKATSEEGPGRLDKENAAMAARDISVDFNRIGLWMKALNQVIAFPNVRLQGLNKFYKTLFDSKDGKFLHKDKAKFAALALSSLVLPSLFIAVINRKDEEYEELSETEKDTNMITFIGGMDLKLPVPHEMGVVFNGLTRRFFDYVVKKDPHAFEGFFGSMWEAGAPGIIPTMVNPFVAAYSNKDAYFGTRIIPAAREDLTAKYQYKDSTSHFARMVGAGVRKIIGEDTRSRLASPAIIEHFITAWTGTLGRLALKFGDAAIEASGLAEKLQREERSFNETYGLYAFSARHPGESSKSIEKFYDNWADASALRNSIRYDQKNEISSDEEKDKMETRFDGLYDYPILKAAKDKIAQLQKEIIEVRNDKNIDPGVKREKIDALHKIRIEVARGANQDTEEHRKNIKKR